VEPSDSVLNIAVAALLARTPLAKVQSANVSLIAGTGNAQLVALSGSAVVYVCGST
jgi:hypothetical protein